MTDDPAAAEPTTGADPAGLADTAMHTGSDDGEPGERRPELVADGDREVLDGLAAQGAPAVQAVEESPGALSAAEDDAPLPVGEAGPQDDGLDPAFQEP